MKSLNKFIATALISSLLFGISSCRNKAEEAAKNKKSQVDISLQVWNVFDDSEIYDPIFSEFQSKYLGLKIEYRKFEDPAEYLSLIIDEMAEGEGPDIFFINNSWIPANYKKLAPADLAFVPPEAFKKTFIGAASDDCIIKGEDDVERVYCMPTYIDNLALYYNKDHFDEKLASEGKPAATWEGIKDQVYKLTKADNSFERFSRSGISMGRSDNIDRAYDILELLMMQAGTKFYVEGGKEAIFANQQGVTPSGQAYYPGKEALDLYTSFAIQNNKQYSWNKYISNPSSKEKEILPFVNGKTSMIIGYSYLYKDLLDQIEIQGKKGSKVINQKDIAIAPIPQIFDSSNAEGNLTLANYFAPAVSRTSQSPQIAWELVNFMSTKDNQKYLYDQTKRPSSRRDLIEDQIRDPLFGVFASQIGYAKSFKAADSMKYEKIFLDIINDVVEKSVKPMQAIVSAQDKVNEILQLKEVPLE